MYSVYYLSINNNYLQRKLLIVLFQTPIPYLITFNVGYKLQFRFGKSCICKSL